MSKVPHPLVTDTMAVLKGLGDKVYFIHVNHSNPLLDDPRLATDHGFHVAHDGLTLPL